LTRAARAGKAVLCEKPIDLDLARVDRCWVEIAALNPTIMIGFNRRFDPSFRQVKERIAAGDIGRLEQLTIVSRDPAPAPSEYLAASGGLFRDMTIHDFDLARFFLGDVVEVYATGANVVADYIAELGDIDSAVVVLRGTDGVLCHITNSRRSVFGYDQRLEAFGSDGMLSVGNQHPTSVRLSTATQTEAASEYLNFFSTATPRLTGPSSTT
jgi:myo-inositol 2-dehydrogenase / D-chiro-inositol 1-dehydrogenase